MNDFRKRLSQTSVTSIITYILFVVAVVFADIMYLQLVTRVVDSGLIVLAIAGAFALGGSVLVLPRKLKNGDIKPGTQRTVAIAVLLTEFAIMAGNVVVAFAEKSGDLPPGILAIYGTYVAPITPVLAALGILLIWLADPIDRAKQTAHEVETAKSIAELELKGQVAMTAVTAMHEFMETNEAKDVMKAAARAQGHRMLREVLSSTGIETASTPAAEPGRDRLSLTFDELRALIRDEAANLTRHAAPSTQPAASAAPSPASQTQPLPTLPTQWETTLHFNGNGNGHGPNS